MGRHCAKPADSEGPEYDVIYAKVLAEFPELVREQGGDAQAIALSALAGRQLPDHEITPLTYRDHACLLERAASELACPDFGMRLAARQNGASVFGPLGQVMRNCRNFGEALGYVSSHAYAHSLAARVWLKALPEESSVFSGHDILVADAGGRRQAIEQVLLVGHLAAMELTGGLARARIVHFRHEPISTLRIYRRYFGCEIRFGQAADGITFNETDLAAPVVAPDQQAFQEITASIERRFTHHTPPFHAQVRQIILRLLATGNCTTRQVSSSLCMHL